MTRWSGTHSFIRNSDSVHVKRWLHPYRVEPPLYSATTLRRCSVDMKGPVSSLNDTSATAARLWFHVKPGVSLRQSSFPSVNTFPSLKHAKTPTG